MIFCSRGRQNTAREALADVESVIESVGWRIDECTRCQLRRIEQDQFGMYLDHPYWEAVVEMPGELVPVAADAAP